MASDDRPDDYRDVAPVRLVCHRFTPTGGMGVSTHPCPRCGEQSKDGHLCHKCTRATKDALVRIAELWPVLTETLTRQDRLSAPSEIRAALADRLPNHEPCGACMYCRVNQATVWSEPRGGIGLVSTCAECRVPGPLAWLAELVDRVEAAEAERDEVRATLERSICEHGSDGDYLCTLILLDESSLSARAHAAEAAVERVRTLHVPEPQPISEHFHCDPSDCDRAGEGGMEDRCAECEQLSPCDTIRALDGE